MSDNEVAKTDAKIDRVQAELLGRIAAVHAALMRGVVTVGILQTGLTAVLMLRLPLPKSSRLQQVD